MFSQIWKKYLPVIALLIKRSATAVQTVTLNHTDFERAAGGRKIKYSFSQLQLNKGRINTEVKHTPMAKELAVVLQEDDVIQKILVGQFFEFSMTNDFKLTIKNNTPPAEPIIEDEPEVEVADNAESEAVVAE